MSSSGRRGTGRGMKLWRGTGRGARPSVALALAVGAACAHPGAGPGGEADGDRFPAPRRAVASPLLEPVSDERRRDQDGEAAYVIDALRLVPGMRVADIGAGTGYYTVRLAARLGPASVIYAQDTDPAALAFLGSRTERERLLNVVPIQAFASDPGLPPGSVDVALLGYSYQRIASPYEFLHRLAGALAPGGRVAVVGIDRQ